MNHMNLFSKDNYTQSEWCLLRYIRISRIIEYESFFKYDSWIKPILGMFAYCLSVIFFQTFEESHDKNSKGYVFSISQLYKQRWITNHNWNHMMGHKENVKKEGFPDEYFPE